ncbi:alpha/beta hydrolase [Paractinoplanes globisporus]|uniref:Alpha/beta hydrolase n=1 Tax=Paractinoplanes globisporus TaxID=113565 RepID=A0ABW6WEV6_9ACTN|nr:alpha/beta hydrolase [Actinoplanes globisporus]
MNQRTNQPTRRQQLHSPRRGRQAIIRWLALPVVLAATLVAAAPAQAYAEQEQHCVRRDLPVILTPAPHVATYRLAGWLCQPRRPGRTVQLLVPGLTYTHQYWTGLDQRTDYVTAAVAAGNAVYLIDRIGTGASDRPPADQVTLTAEATVVHQAIQALRDGTLGRYRTVAGVGHSFGTVVWMAEAATYHDVDALVLTGLLHQIDLDVMTRFTTDLHPAGDDPKFAQSASPEGYLTTLPGRRAAYFLDPATAEPGASTWDEATKTTATTGELTYTPQQELAYSRAITAPILLVVGARDALFCGPTMPCTHGADICQREQTTYASNTGLIAVTIASTGHSLNLHTSAPSTRKVINGWLRHQATESVPGVDLSTCH